MIKPDTSFLTDSGPTTRVLSPLESLGKVAQYRNLLAQGQLHQAQIRNEDEQIRVHKATADEAERSAAALRKQAELESQFTTKGENGEIQRDDFSIIKGLTDAGYQKEAAQVDATRRLNLTSAIKDAAEKTKQIKERAALASQLLQPVLNAPPDQATILYQQSRAQAIAAGFDPKNLPEQYDPNFVKQQAQAGIDADKQADNHQKTLEFANTLVMQAPDTAKKWSDLAYGHIAGTQNQEQLDQAIQVLKSQNAPPAVLAAIPTKWSQQAVSALGAQTITPEQRTANDLNQKKFEQELTDFAEKVRHNKADERETARYHTLSVEGTDLTPAAKTKMAEMFAQTGVLPSFGMGKAAGKMKSEIINEAATRFPQVDFATAKAAFQSNQASLTNLRKQQDSIESFENTAGKNLDQFLETAKGVVDSGSPFINKPLRSIGGGVLGSADQKAFDVARQVAVTEIAKVLNNPNGSAALSDSARKEVQDLIGPNATLKQIYQASNILRTDMKNRRESGKEQIKAIEDRIGTRQGEEKKVEPASTGGDLSKLSTEELLKRLK